MTQPRRKSEQCGGAQRQSRSREAAARASAGSLSQDAGGPVDRSFKHLKHSRTTVSQKAAVAERQQAPYGHTLCAH